MKKVLLAATLFSASVIFTSAEAQVRVSINANIGNQPSWGPSGYDYAQFYYLPDIDMYYDVFASQFVYQNNGRWAYTRTLPVRYRNYDLYRGYKVVVNEPRAYMHYDAHRNKYKRYKNYRGRQVAICNSHDPRYAPYHKQYNNRVVVVR